VLLEIRYSTTGPPEADEFSYWIIRAWALSGRSCNPFFEAADLKKAICKAAERKFAVTLARLLVTLTQEMDRSSAIGM